MFVLPSPSKNPNIPFTEEIFLSIQAKILTSQQWCTYRRGIINVTSGLSPIETGIISLWRKYFDFWIFGFSELGFPPGLEQAPHLERLLKLSHFETHKQEFEVSDYYHFTWHVLFYLNLEIELYEDGSQ